MTATAWVVLAHNTRLAQHYQEYQVRNAFGDGFAYCLCPAQPATRDYILALIGELVASYDVDVVECFCPACQRLLREEGIDSEPLQARVRDAVDRGFDQGPADASRVEEIFRQDAELWTLVTKRVQTVTALIADIAALVHARGKKLFCFAPVFVEPASLDWVEGTQARRLAPLVDCWELALYSPDQPERVARAQRAASLAGIEHIGFYNYGVLPQARLGWLSQAAEAFRS
jgi:hypothetical protein